MVAEEETRENRRLELWQFVSTSEEDHDQTESSYHWMVRHTTTTASPAAAHTRQLLENTAAELRWW